MISLLLDGSDAGAGGSWWILLAMVAVLVVMFVISAVKRKKYNQETVAMLDSLKPGDKIKTYSGVYGTVISIRETTDGKVVTIETGDDEHKSYTSIDANSIYCLDKKTDIVYDSNGEIVTPEAETSDTAEVAEAEATVEVSEEHDETEVDESKKRKNK